MATFTSRLGIRMPDPTDLVSVTTDINDGASRVDAAVGYQSVTAFPASPYAGKSVMVSNDSYRTYFSNGTSPASGSWVELLNSSGTFGSNIKLASGSQLVIGADTNLFRNAANVLRTNDALIVDSDVTVSGDLRLVGGATTYRNKLSGGQVSVSNTVAETTIATMTIPANDAVVGAVYRLVAWGTIAVTGTPTLSFKGKIGPGLFGTASRTASSGVTGRAWRVEADLVVLSTGGSGSWFGNISLIESASQATAPTAGATTDGTVSQTVSTTASQTFVITFTWGTASASNALACYGFYAERVA